MKAAYVFLSVLAMLTGVAKAADPVAGTWKTQNGETALIARCGSNYCITAKTGNYAGQQLGSFTAMSDAYVGRLTDPQTKATYSGKLTLSGADLKLRGCVTSVLCKTQTWTRLN